MPKPVLFSEDYGTERFDPRVKRSQDPSRIPGWSEIVQANDIAKADDLEFRNLHVTAKGIKTKEDVYKLIGAKPQQLPVEFKWLRISGPGGANSATANAEIDAYTTDQGFISCTIDKFNILRENYGYKFNDAAWFVAEDGTIRRGYDVALFFRSGEVAKVWDQYLAEENAKAEGGSFPDSLRAAGEVSETFKEEETEEIVIKH